MAKHASSVTITSAIDLYSKSYEVVMRNLKSFGVLLALPALAAVLAAFHYSGGGRANWQHFNLLSSTLPAYVIIGLVGTGLFILFIVTVLAALLMQAMLTVLEIEGAQGMTPALSHLWKMGKKYWLRLFGLFMAVGLYFLMAALAGSVVLLLFWLLHALRLGVFLYIVWAVVVTVFLIQNYYLAPYVLVDQDKLIYESLQESSKLVKGRAKHIWSIIGVSVLIGVTGGLPFIGPIISFILGSLYSVAPALRYFELKKMA